MMKMTFLGPKAEGRRFSLRRMRRRSVWRQTGFFFAAVLLFSCGLYTQPNGEGGALNVTETPVQGDNTLSELSVLFDDLGSLSFKNDDGEWVGLTASNFNDKIKEYKLNLNIGKNMTVISARASSKDAEVTFTMNDTIYLQGVFRNLPPARGVINVIVKPKSGEENIYTLHLDRTVLDWNDYKDDAKTLAALDEYLSEINDDTGGGGDWHENNPLPIRVLGLNLTDPNIFKEQPVFMGKYNLYLDLDLSGCIVGTLIDDADSEYIFHRIEKNSIPGIEYIVRFVLPESVVEIADGTLSGAGVFSEYTNLREIHLPGVKKIGAYAFSLHTNLKTVDALVAKEIGERAFESCINIESIDMPELTTISTSSFASCIKLKSFRAPKSAAIGGEAFANCYALSELKFGSGGSWESIGDYIFENLPDSCLKQIKVYTASGAEAVLVTESDTYWGTYKDNNTSSLALGITNLSNIPWSPPVSQSPLQAEP
ncbi:MAG: leucine-rich repeat domain-containing protein [Spirochaetaceae bacterium]|jgi:hypothetical protein|nr:leucine-rich repeat domain-containing protein [Spirochaetaceae bacterium]